MTINPLQFISARYLLLFVAIFASAFTSLAAATDFRLGSPFSDHMVLQREKSVAVWGWANVRLFFATLYFFGREIHREVGVPVGLICSAVGAIMIHPL